MIDPATPSRVQPQYYGLSSARVHHTCLQRDSVLAISQSERSLMHLPADGPAGAKMQHLSRLRRIRHQQADRVAQIVDGLETLAILWDTFDLVDLMVRQPAAPNRSGPRLRKRSKLLVRKPTSLPVSLAVVKIHPARARRAVHSGRGFSRQDRDRHRDRPNKENRCKSSR